MFQLLERHFAEFERVYAERFAPSYGHWRPIVAGTVAKFLRCGDLHEGFARVKCRACKHEFFVAFSCKQRCVCASCHQKRSLILSDRLAAEVCAEVAHRQFVFTMPKRLRVFFRFDRALLGDLARLAWETVLEVYRATLGRDDLVPGMVAGIQTFGELIHWHPHIHALAPDGAFDETGTFHPLPAVAAEPFRELFAQKVLGLLLGRGKIGAEVVENLRSWKHSGFSVDKSVRIEAGDRAGLERLLRYIVRCPFSIGRVVKLGLGDHVIYRAEHDDPRRFPMPQVAASRRDARDSPADPSRSDGTTSAVAAAAEQALRAGPARNFQVFEPLAFIAEVTQHVPNAGQHLIHYYGWYSNKSRGLRARAAAECGRGLSAASASADPAPAVASAAAMEEELSRAEARRRWAALIKRVYEVDPLRCPKCGGEMRVIAFIERRQRDVIRKILEHCGLWEEPRAPARTPPVAAQASLELRYEADPDYVPAPEEL
jgi:hypothetical protein